MQFRTDLAIESAEQGVETPPGVKQESRQIDDIKLTKIVIEDEQGEKALGRPKGSYITAELPPLSDDEHNTEEKANLLGDELRSLCPSRGPCWWSGSKPVGDARRARPRAAGLVLATRHIRGFARTTGLDN